MLEVMVDAFRDDHGRDPHTTTEFVGWWLEWLDMTRVVMKVAGK